MEDSAELESFRRQWREEVSRRAKPTIVSISQSCTSGQDRLPVIKHENVDHHDDINDISGEQRHGELEQWNAKTTGEDSFQRVPPKEPSSALEHFERAVQKEAEGKLGDSLSHYRQAYRLDARVDQTYRKKHFASSSKGRPDLPNIVVKTPNDEPREERTSMSTAELIASSANLRIPRAEPIIESTSPPSCPISNLPSEVLVEILTHVALMDPASFSRMALVCRRLAYHFAYEQQVWKRLCRGRKFGFGGMHYSFACEVTGSPIFTLGPRYTPFPHGVAMPVPKPSVTWKDVFQTFPRIRFTGIYISTVNYTRAGAASSDSALWNSPIHIVTYYRYLRFYPDGTVISLLTTTEPTDVVPYISKENMAPPKSPLSHQEQHQRQRSHSTLGALETSATTNPIPPTVTATLKHALHGRWHLAHPTPMADPGNKMGRQEAHAVSRLPTIESSSTGSPDLRDVIIETEGADPKYTYQLHLSLRSSNPSRYAGPDASPPNPPKNTKLIWKGFWSYNTLTDDWAEFGLRNDRAFVFRRVRGWGMNDF